jgi:general secretion pathway protein C
VFLVGVAFFVARTANAFIEAALLPIPVPSDGRSGLKPVMAEPVLPLSMERIAKLTGLPVPKPEVEVKEPAMPQIDMDSPPVHSSLRLKLLGTLLSANPEWSVCSIQDVVTLKTNTYMVGDVIQGAEVLEIERKRVIIKHNNRREYIDENPGDGSAAPPPPVQTIAAAPAKYNDAPPPSANLGATIKQMSENEYEVPRAEIDKTLSNLNDVAMQARIVPAFKDGVAQGFKLFSIRPDSIYSKIGVQNGDVIKRINGYDLNSPEKALEVYSKLKEASRIDIEVERNGASVRKTYNVR